MVMANKKKDAEKDAKPGSDQPGFEASRRTDEGDIDQIDGNGMGLPVEDDDYESAREGTSGTGVNRFGPQR